MAGGARCHPDKISQSSYPGKGQSKLPDDGTANGNLHFSLFSLFSGIDRKLAGLSIVLDLFHIFQKRHVLS